MKRWTAPAVVATTALVVSVLVVPAYGASGSRPDPSTPPPGTTAPIRLQATTFDPGAGQAPDVPPGLEARPAAAGRSVFYVVQLDGPVGTSARDALEATGAEIVAYIPDNAFKVRMTPEQARTVESLDAVVFVGRFHAAYKFGAAGVEPNGLNHIVLADGTDVAAVVGEIDAIGAAVVRADERDLVVSASADQLAEIARVEDTAWIEPFAIHEKHNEFGAGAIMGTATANTNGFDGSTQTVAVADSGFGDGTAAGGHSSIPASRVSAIFNWTAPNERLCYRVYPDGAQDVDTGHGTHTSVSAVGGGGAGGEGRGAAPAAHLVFQATEDYLDTYGLCSTLPDGYYLIGLPLDLHPLYQQAYNAGARIHSNSWGSDAAGDYTADSADTDDFMWDNPDMLVTFSAGNEAVDANLDGVVDNDSMGSPATAKNVLTVGASENARADYACDTGLGYVSSDAYQPGETCTSMSGENILGTAGQRWGFTAEPLNSDVTAGNAEQMAPFSSRGPTDDGRIKPDVVAPGTWVLSGYSSLYQEGYGDPLNPRNGLYQWDGWGMPRSDSFKYMGGTSMSNPLAAGAAAVVRDYYEKADGHAASAALVKATLVNSAVDLLDENNDGVDDNDYPIPNVHEGWGRIDVAAATDGSHTYVDDPAGIATGALASYPVEVAAGADELRITLAWTDFPSTAAAAVNLVDNLDLEVVAPGGTTYRGNVFAAGASIPGGAFDDVNNLENVYVDSPAAGTWTVNVVGTSVPMGPQPFALVVDGGQDIVPPPPTGWGGIDFDGTGGNYAVRDIPRPASTSIVDVAAWVALDDWTPASSQAIVGESTALLVRRDGRLQVQVRLDTGPAKAVSVPLPAMANGAALWVRVVLDASTGFFTFYTSGSDTNDPAAVVWQQLGAPVDGRTIGVPRLQPRVVLGQLNRATRFPMDGRLRGAVVKYDAAEYALDLTTTDDLTSTPPDYSQWGPWSVIGPTWTYLPPT